MRRTNASGAVIGNPKTATTTEAGTVTGGVSWNFLDLPATISDQVYVVTLVIGAAAAMLTGDIMLDEIMG